MAESNSVTCCPNENFDAVVDYAACSGTARSYMERKGIIPTLRNPRPRTDPMSHRIHTYPLEAPLPLPELMQHVNGSPPPDRGQTTEWPPTTTEAES